MKKKYLFPVIAFIFTFHFSFSQNAEKLPTNITESTVLSKQSIFFIESDIVLNEGVVLTIEEGVIFKSTKEVNFKIGHGAKIIACGSYEHPIKAFKDDQNYDMIFQASYFEEDPSKKLNLKYDKIENPTVIVRQL